MESTNQSIKKTGSLNPMWGKRQSLDTKKKISDSQKERYEKIRQQIQSESIKTNNAEQEAKLDLLKQCIFTDSIQFRDRQQAINFIDIMSHGIQSDYLKRIINDELNKHLKGLNRHVE